MHQFTQHTTDYEMAHIIGNGGHNSQPQLALHTADVHTMELAYHGNGNVRGVVNDTTAHAQKCDVRMTTTDVNKVTGYSCARVRNVLGNAYLSSLTKNLEYEEREQLDSGSGGALSQGAGHDGSFYRYAV